MSTISARFSNALLVLRDKDIPQRLEISERDVVILQVHIFLPSLLLTIDLRMFLFFNKCHRSDGIGKKYREFFFPVVSPSQS